MANETFKEALRLLNTLPSNAVSRNISATADTAHRQVKFDQFAETMSLIGYPPSRLDSLNIIHIAGSKGKGSTAALTASMLSQFLGDHRVPRKIGVFASPHVRTIRERIRIISCPVTDSCDGIISEAQFAAYFMEVWDRLQAHHASGAVREMPSFFKCLLAVAVHAFASEGVDAAILECGIGGEYDGTNVVGRAVVGAITTLELEHTDVLGADLTSIAWHKAGIMRAGVPVFTIPQREEARAELQRRAKEKGALLTVVEPPAATADSDKAGGWYALNKTLARCLATTPLARLRGQDRMEPSEMERRLELGARQRGLPGRFEIRHAGSSSWYIDGAHTLASVAKAAEWFAACTTRKDSDADADARILLFNQEGRETREMLALLHGKLQGVVPGGLAHVLLSSNAPFSVNGFSAEARSMMCKLEVDGKPRQNYQEKNAAIWASMSGGAGPEVSIFGTVCEAVEYVRREFVSKGRRVSCLATGSLHLVGSPRDCSGPAL